MPDTETDPVLRKLGELVASVRTVQSQQSEILANQANHGEAQARLAARFNVLELDVRDLRRVVHGSHPPPADGAPPLVSAVTEATREASSASLDVAGLEGRMIAGFVKLEAKLAAQDRALGVGLQGLRALLSPPVLRTLPAVIAAAAALAAALRGAPAPVPVASSPVAPVHVSAQR